MQELEKILEEIDQEVKEYMEIDFGDEYNAGIKDMAKMAKKIIRKHMNDGWISVEEQLPEDGSRVLAVIKHHKWIADYDSSWVPECEKTQHPEYTEVCESIASEEGWTYRCHEMDYEADEAYIKPKRDIANPISEVIAWRPLPEPYRSEQPEACKYTGGSCCWPIDQCSDCPNNPERSENDQ